MNSKTQAAQGTTISAEQLKQKILEKQDIAIIDVREKYEFEKDHIKQSINVPLSNFENEITGKMLPKEKEIITVCTHGIRAQRAMQKLQNAGFKARVLEGGLARWKKAHESAQK